MKLSEFIGLLDYDSMVGTDPLDMPICIISPDDEGFMNMSYSGVIRKIPGALLNGDIDNIILPADSDETLTITVDGVVYPNGGMNPSSSEVEDFFTGASSRAEGKYIIASKYDLVGQDGNAFALMGYTSRALKNEGLRDLVPEMQERATSGDYWNLIAVCDEYIQMANDAAEANGYIDDGYDDDDNW